ncbi:MAG TPA: hypothetical protein VG297_02280 [Bryobacteraceae bacterium]|nr:hypothetical protein [Bryobacteraceae bacterium]
MNGTVAGTIDIEADGSVSEVAFGAPIAKSSWVALRILRSSYTNPLWVPVNVAPFRASKKSADWRRQAVDVCWQSKPPRIRPGEIEKARAAFQHARVICDRIASECVA